MPTNVYRSRSRTTRTRLILAGAVVLLVMLGFAIGRLVDDDAQASPTVPAPSSEPVPGLAPPSPSESAPEPAPTGGVDAYQRLEVENAAEFSGLDMQDTGDEGGGKNAGWISNGDWIRFDEVNFGAEPPTQVNIRVAADIGDDAGGRVEIRLGSPTATPSATLVTSRTGGWQTWRTEATTMGPATGLHTVFVTFASDRPEDFLNLNWLAFRR